MLSGPGLRAKNGNAKRLVVLLHGYGSNGEDLIGLAPYFAAIDPEADFLSPNAVEPSRLNPGGYQWFPIPFIDGSSAEAMTKGLIDADKALAGFLGKELGARNLSGNDLILIGFSQGTMMALHTGLRRAGGLKAIIGFSGRLIFPAQLEKEIRSRPPVQLIHGEEDDVVPASDSVEAETFLKNLGLDARLFISPKTAHSISEDGLRTALGFYAEIIKQQVSSTKGEADSKAG